MRYFQKNSSDHIFAFLANFFLFSRQKNYLSTMLISIITNDQVSHIFIKFRAINLNADIFFPLPFRFGASLLFIFSFVFSASVSFPLLFRIIPAFRPSVFYGWFRYGFSVFVNTPTISGSVMTLDFNVTAIVLTANRNKFLITRVFIMF